MKSLNILWTQDERERIVRSAVRIQRGSPISKFQALRAGMKSALPENRWRNTTGVHSFGPYITDKFDSIMNSPELLGEEQYAPEPLPKTEPAESTKLDIALSERTSSLVTQSGMHGSTPTAGFRNGILEFVLPEIRIPIPEITDRIVELVEARVMERIQKVMQASGLAHITPAEMPPPPDPNGLGVSDVPKELPTPKIPSPEGSKLHVVVLGVMPQRKQWLNNAIPARLRNRLTLDFQMVWSGAAALPEDHIVVHSTMAEEPLALTKRDRYYRCSLNMQSVLNTLLLGADFHLNQMDSNQ